MAAARQHENGEVAAPEEARTKFREPAATSYDVIVIGAGSAGLSAASIANTLGPRGALLGPDPFRGGGPFTRPFPPKAPPPRRPAAPHVPPAADVGAAAPLPP